MLAIRSLDSALALAQSRGTAIAISVSNFSAAELAARLPARRAGDPLGLGLVGAAAAALRAAPPDPDAYDRAREDAAGARSLLSAADRAALDAEAFLTPAEVRALIAENCGRDQLETVGLDADLLLIIDARIDYKIFIAGDNVYTREELYASFPFGEFGTQPEAVFAAQEVGVFESGLSLGSGTGGGASTAEYALRDAGDERLEFRLATDLVRAARATAPAGLAAPAAASADARAPTRVVRTKIFVGREAWDDFCLQAKLCRGAVRMAATQVRPVGLLGAPPEAHSRHSESYAQLAERVARLERQVAELERQLRI